MFFTASQIEHLATQAPAYAKHLPQAFVGRVIGERTKNLVGSRVDHLLFFELAYVDKRTGIVVGTEAEDFEMTKDFDKENHVPIWIVNTD